jgi:cytochrome c oxidase cbb3-type subunit I/II
MIRPMRPEAIRYGEPSTVEESIFDHPFQWGSKRTGPDLAREGGRYPNLWHYRHMLDPRSTSPGSNMPAYPHLLTNTIDPAGTAARLEAMRTLGVPYTDAMVAAAATDERAQAESITRDLADNGARATPDSEMVALIAYLQRLGRTTQPLWSPTPAAAPAAPAPAAPAPAADADASVATDASVPTEGAPAAH